MGSSQSGILDPIKGKEQRGMRADSAVVARYDAE